MIYEYALEPELVATWHDRKVGRYFIEKFGLGQPRIVSRYPKCWKKLVWDAFRSNNDLDRKRMEELLTRLTEPMVKRRQTAWDAAQSWLGNAEREHQRVPFHAILARQNPSGHAQVLVADDLDQAAAGLWALPRGVTVARSAADMADAVKALLAVAEVVHFVDPHFRPESRHRRSLEALLRVLAASRAKDRACVIQIHTSTEKTGTAAAFAAECQRVLPRCIPSGLQVTIRRLQNRDGGERLHNRYILTDVGGVSFGVGLDEGDPGTTDDIAVLEDAQYVKRWQQYAGNPSAFDQPEPAFSVTGQ